MSTYEKVDLKRLSYGNLTEFHLDHGALSKMPNRGSSTALQNVVSFREDYKAGLLDHYKESSVAFHKGIFCGQGRSESKLLDAVQSYYGGSALAVFFVPKKESDLENAILNAMGDFD
jgi:hypothetical protein